MDADIAQEFSNVRNEFSTFRSEVSQEFSRVHERLDKMDRRFDRMDERIDDMADQLLRDLRSFIEVLREDQRSEHRAFLDEIKGHRTQLGDHEKRIKKLERKKSA